MPRTLTIHRDAAYEIQAFWTRTEGRAGLDDWLGASARVLAQYGGSPLATLEPIKALYGEYLPTVVRLFVWPDAAALEASRIDPAYSALAPLLAEAVEDDTLTRLRLHPQIHAEPEQIELTFDDRLCYEISTFWDRPDAERAHWHAFIDAVTPSIGAHGGHPLLVFEPTACERGDFSPDRICLAAWDSVEHFESFVAAPEHGEISRLRWLAVSRMDAIATRLAAPASIFPANGDQS